MRLLARFPTLSAWLLVLALIGVGTLATVQGLRVLEPSTPPHLDHIHGYIVAMRAGNVFAVTTSPRAKVVWFRIARGAHISLAHVLRHLHEQAPTDVYYEIQGHGMPLAWIAD